MSAMYDEQIVNPGHATPHDVQIVVMYGATLGQEENINEWLQKPGYRVMSVTDNKRKCLDQVRAATGLIIRGLRRRSPSSVNMIDWLGREIRYRNELPELKTLILEFDEMELPWVEMPETKLWGSRAPSLLRWSKHQVIHWLPDSDYMKAMQAAKEKAAQLRQTKRKMTIASKIKRREEQAKKMKELRGEAAKVVSSEKYFT